MRDLDIGAVARQAGVTVSTLRFYESQGLIGSNGRRGLRRQFPATVIERLALIALGRAAGFSLEEIGGMFAREGGPRIDRRKLAARADALDAKIRQLEAMRNGLRHAADCPARSHMECPTFRRLLRIAGSGRLAPGRKKTA